MTGSPTPLRILGVDPGTRTAGWGIVDRRGNRCHLVAFGAIRTRGPEMHERLHEVFRGLLAVVAEHAPHVVAVERPFVARNPQTALSIGMARGTALLVAADGGLPVHEYTPAMVKKANVGNGAAGKHQVAAMVRAQLGLTEVPKPEDASDALAVALTHAHRVR